MDRRSDFEARGGGDRHQKKSKSTKDDGDRSRLFDVDGNVRPVTASGRQKNQASFMPSPLASHLLSNTYKGPGGLGKGKGLMYMLQTPSKDPMYEESEEEDVNADVGGGSSDQAFHHSTEHDDDDDVPPESERGSSRVLATKLPLEGRPPIMDLIPTYKNHVARYIWNGGQDRGVLDCHSRYNRLTSWVLDEDTTNMMVLESGLAHLSAIMYEHLDVPLISAFVERWYPETNSFHLPFGEMTITLHDVWYLLKVRVLGDPLILSCSGSSDIANVFADEFKLNKSAMDSVKATLGWKHGKISYSGLQAFIEQSRCAPRQVANGYLLWLLNATLFVDKSRTSGSGSFLEVVRKNVKKTAWGAATLAYLYREMGRASRNGSRQIGGCLTLLQAWIYAYFPGLRPQQNTMWNIVDPHCARWLPLKKSRGSHASSLLEHRKYLDRCNTDCVAWTPFSTTPAKEVPISLYVGVIACGPVTEAYMPDRVVRQFGYVQDIPTPPMKPSIAIRDEKCRKYMVEHSAAFVDMFASWKRHRISLDDDYTPAAVQGQCVDEYMEWFLERTHSRLFPTPQLVPGDAQIPLHLQDFHPRLQQITKIVAPYHPGIDVAGDHTNEELLHKIREVALLCEDMIPGLHATSFMQ